MLSSGYLSPHFSVPTMSRSLQGSSACKLPFKCCDFVVSQFNYLFPNLWNSQKPPPACYTTSVVGLLAIMVVLLLGISQRKILPQKHLGPCIKSLALLLHCSLAGARFNFLRNPLLLHLWTPDLLLLCLLLPLLQIPQFREAICTSRPTSSYTPSSTTSPCRCCPPTRSSLATLPSTPREGSPLPL